MKKILLILSLFFFLSCKVKDDSGVLIQQVGTCIYNDGKLLMFEIKYECKSPNKTTCNKIVKTRYKKGFEVGREYIIILK